MKSILHTVKSSEFSIANTTSETKTRSIIIRTLITRIYFWMQWMEYSDDLNIFKVLFLSKAHYLLMFLLMGNVEYFISKTITRKVLSNVAVHAPKLVEKYFLGMYLIGELCICKICPQVIYKICETMMNLLSSYKEYKNTTNLRFATKIIVELTKYFLTVSPS